ncbi:cytochrome P450 [Polyangium aurulentum]|uniref:cytochrome P450 n=1 Tax=Polyangium aurulentum TaxID=2567896 RepID=UPI00197E4483|nr:cytochrome P450 [Polyangium aurulentum]UQA63364.1 cytochrome P450 [Polyangium aurulentum]
MGTAPGSLPWIGHAWQLLRRPLSFLTSLRRSGDVVKIQLGPECAYLVRHPELLRQVLVNDPAIFDKGGPVFEKARTLVGNGLASCPHKAHRRQRQLMQPAFNRDRLSSYAAVMRDQASAMADAWRPGQVVDVHKEMNSLALAVVARTLCVTDAAERTAAELQRSVPVILEGMYHQMLAPVELWQKLPLPGNLRFNRAFRRTRAAVDQIIDDYRRAGVDHGDLLSTLLAARDEDTGEGMTNREIRDQIMTLLLAGTETAAATLAWAFHLLGQHSEIERRLHAEVDEVLSGRVAGFDDVPKLGYTQRVISETLRLYPPTWLLSRRTTEEVTLGGHRLAPGTNILFSLYALQRDPDLFPDPERFDPDRWLPDRSKAVPRGAMLPFGAGQRKCIGEAFGVTEATIVLSTLTGRFRLRPIQGAKIDLVPRMTLNPGALPMRVEARDCAGKTRRPREGSAAPSPCPWMGPSGS